MERKRMRGKRKVFRMLKMDIDDVVVVLEVLEVGW